VSPCTTDYLVGVVGIAGNPAHNCWEILATLCLEAIDEIDTVLCIERAIIPVVSVPYAATRRIDKLVDARD
jgi:hypothetical protein